MIGRKVQVTTPPEEHYILLTVRDTLWNWPMVSDLIAIVGSKSSSCDAFTFTAGFSHVRILNHSEELVCVW